jgi:hypothetical protein
MRKVSTSELADDGAAADAAPAGSARAGLRCSIDSLAEAKCTDSPGRMNSKLVLMSAQCHTRFQNTELWLLLKLGKNLAAKESLSAEKGRDETAADAVVREQCYLPPILPAAN